MPAAFTKDPGDILDYSFDWSKWLSLGETIASTLWTASAPGITVVSDSHSDTQTTVWLSGGSNTAVYTVKNKITTSQARTVERTMTITCVNKDY